MRYLERSILLQVIDNRWREHLYDMDYLREGIHLRGFAQIDPLVAYKNEGFAMFEELMHSIWEEFSKLVFNAEIEIDPGQQIEGRVRRNGGGAPTALDYSGGTPDAQPSALQEVAAGGGVSVTEGRGARRTAAATARRRRRSSRRWSRTSGRKTSGGTTRAGVGRGRSTRSATGPEGAVTGASRGPQSVGSGHALTVRSPHLTPCVPQPAWSTTPSRESWRIGTRHSTPTGIGSKLALVIHDCELP